MAMFVGHEHAVPVRSITTGAGVFLACVALSVGAWWVFTQIILRVIS